VIPIHIPPLRERREDIIPLVEHYLSRLAVRTGKEIREISPDALTALYDYDYPGNVRELTNILERAFVLCHQEQIDLIHLPAEVVAAGARGPIEQPEGQYGEQPGFSDESTGDAAAISRSDYDASGKNQLPSDWPSRLKPSERRLLSSPVNGTDGGSEVSRRSAKHGPMRPEVQRLLGSWMPTAGAATRQREHWVSAAARSGGG